MAMLPASPRLADLVAKVAARERGAEDAFWKQVADEGTPIPGTGAPPLTGSTTANLPGLVIGFDDGRALEATRPATVTLHRTTTTEHDGDFDNAIMSHEWGHYLHHPGVISIDLLNPLSSRHVFGGKNPSFPARDPLALNFGTRFAGQAIQLRFRIGTSSSIPASGWRLDDIAVSGITNTPFPAFVAEPTKCVAGASAITGDGGVVQVRSAPRYRLDTTPAAAGTR